ncbi:MULTISPECIES: LysR substrate-binding domain-containing protein [Pantoea]|uniref:Glycine cleavage system regulatory protein n=2 Tax=Pantoea TaxID=53335 RepID=A0A0U3UPJ0_9GAMM|nr:MULTISPECIES: LysR substrate-binding domain-containing protein [Pantoea]ALV91801.1 glycine cleavage system regulatory protein [Pantoea vagans]KHJ66149.1 glycine cleavage system regulatory protein [Pantoea rodasii]
MSDFPPVAMLRAFESVARLGSLTLAASELSVTHSAISQQIKALEGLLGVRLFTRQVRGVQINEEGRLYALQIREALARIADATRQVQVKPRRAELSLSMVPSFASHWLIPRLTGFQAQFPHIYLRLQASLSVSDVQQEGTDIAIRMGKGEWAGLLSQKLFSDRLIVVAAPHFNGGDLPRTPQQIAASEILFTLESWNDWCEAAGLQQSITPRGLVINDSNLIIQAVRLGQGIALERLSLVHDALQRGELVQLSPVSVDYTWPYWLVTRKDRSTSPEEAAFITWLEKEVIRYQGMLNS